MGPSIARFLIFIAALWLPACQSDVGSSSYSTSGQSAVVSAHGLATQAGVKVLQQGGNAFDAAVAVAASLGVVEPFGSGIGGGGFWLLYSAKDDRYIFLDARETAPASARHDQFIDQEGKRDPRLAIDSGLSVGIPGQVRAFEHIVQHYGTLRLAEVLQPAIDHAEQGFSVDQYYIQKLSHRIERLREVASSAHFLEAGEIPSLGFRIVQQDLANTLRAIAENGSQSFYAGKIADQLVQAVNNHGGSWSKKDLSEYQVIEREPLIGNFAGAKVVTAPPPSAGGLSLLQMLGILDHHKWSAMDEELRTHVTIEAMKQAYRIRAEYVGDPDFVSIPVARLVSRHGIEEMAKSIDFMQASSVELDSKTPKEGSETTHLAVWDQYGNRVAATLSINLSFGSGVVADGTGVLLNNELDDFSSGAGVPNAYGLIGSEPNRIQPGKRPVSSMTPTFVEWDDRVAVIGTPGGSRIVTMVLLAALEAADKKTVDHWTSRPRFHHQYSPNQVQYEPDAFDTPLIKSLESKGHILERLHQNYGNLHVIEWSRRQGLSAAADPRGIGEAWVGTVAR